MDYETRFPASLIDTNELADLTERMAKMTGAAVDHQTVIIVSTDDAEFSGVLDTLAYGLSRKKAKPVEERVRKVRKGKSAKVTGEKSLVKKAQGWDAEIADLAKPVAVETKKSAKK